jgi:hypothetical protein
LTDYSNYQPELKGPRMRLDTQRAESQVRKVIERGVLRVRLTIRHPNLTSSEITDMIGIAPSYTMEKGELIAPKVSERLCVDRTSWTLSTEKHVRSRDSHKHLEWLVDLLDGRTPTLNKWKEDGADLSITYREDTWGRFNRLMISADLLARLARLGVSLSFQSHYQNTDAEY